MDDPATREELKTHAASSLRRLADMIEGDLPLRVIREEMVTGFYNIVRLYRDCAYFAMNHSRKKVHALLSGHCVTCFKNRAVLKRQLCLDCEKNEQSANEHFRRVTMLESVDPKSSSIN